MNKIFAGLILVGCAQLSAETIPSVGAFADHSTELIECSDDPEPYCSLIEGEGFAEAAADYGTLFVSAGADFRGYGHASAFFIDQLTIQGGIGVGTIEWDFRADWNGYYGSNGVYSLPESFTFGIPITISAGIDACGVSPSADGYCSGGGVAYFNIEGMTILGIPLVDQMISVDTASGHFYPLTMTTTHLPEPATFALIGVPLAALLLVRRQRTRLS